MKMLWARTRSVAWRLSRTCIRPCVAYGWDLACRAPRSRRSIARRRTRPAVLASTIGKRCIRV
eukprot:4092228-Prymnesium_polylepis.1